MSRLEYTVERLQPIFGPQETQDLLGLFRTLAPEHNVPDGEVIDNVVAQTENENQAIFVARLDTQAIIGMAAVHLLPKGLELEARLEEVATNKAYEGNGVGGAVVSACVEWAKQKGADHMDLTSAPTREAANHLYEKLGFKLRDTNVRRLDLNGS